MYHSIKKLIILIWVIIGCNGSNKDIIDNLSTKERDVFYNTFRNLTILRRGNFILIKTYNGNKMNEYSFELVNIDSGTIYKKRILNIQYSDTKYGEYFSTDSLRSFIEKMNKLNITSVSSDMNQMGIDLKVYLFNGQVRLYIVNERKIKNDIFLNYFNESTKLTKYWYKAPS